MAWRSLVRGRAGGWKAIAVLALGVGVVAATFSVLDAVLLRPLPFPRPHQLVVIIGAPETPDGRVIRWWGQARAFSGLAIVSSGGVNVGSAMPFRASAAVVSSGFFSLLGVAPRLGRAFGPVEDASGASVAILSDAFWRADLGADPNVLHRKLVLDGRTVSIVGVMPRGFDFPSGADIWMPRPGSGYAGAFQLGPAPAQKPAFAELLGRLRNGVTLAQAEAQLRVLLRREGRTFAKSGVSFGGLEIAARPLHDYLVGGAQGVINLLLAASALLLIIAVADAAGIFLSAWEGRRHETAVRCCCGATWARLAVGCGLEALLVGLAAGALGTASAVLTQFLTEPSLAAAMPLARRGTPVGVALGFGMALGLVSALAASTPSLWRLRHVEIAGSLGAEVNAARSPRSRVRAWFLGAQIALTLALLWAALLVVVSLQRALAVRPGFATSQAIAAEVSLPAIHYRGEPAKAGEMVERLLATARAIPGVVAAGATSQLPLDGSIGNRWLARPPAISEGLTGPTFEIAGSYLAAMGIPLVRGRSFAAADRAQAPLVAIISRSCSRRFWGDRDPIGDSIVVGGQARRVVGVVGDVRAKSLLRVPGPQVYVPMLQPFSKSPLTFSLVVRTSRRNSAAIVPVLRDHLGQAAGVPIYRVRTLEAAATGELAPLRLAAELLWSLAALALGLAIAGIYAISNDSVARRARELGIRVALGARPCELVGLVLRGGAIVLIPGAAVGIALALWAGRLLRSLLFGVTPGSAWVLGAAASAIGAAALAGALPAALRAARISPAVVLRRE